jgi:hypothetical protein
VNHLCVKYTEKNKYRNMRFDMPLYNWCWFIYDVTLLSVKKKKKMFVTRKKSLVLHTILNIDYVFY